jgi:hypothetical protein
MSAKLLNTHSELDELGGGRYRHVQYLRAIAYRDGGELRRIANDWADSGDGDRPHIVSAAPFTVSVAPDGLRRIHPTREPDRYFEFGAPYLYVAGQWRKVALGTPKRSANRLLWQTANADVAILHAGHYVKLAIELKGGWLPPTGRVAFPVGLTGLTRLGGTLLREGVPVMGLRAPLAYDAANPNDVRQIAHEFVRVSDQWYVLLTLPDLAGMARPVIDPSFAAQPDAADGLDAYIVSGAAANYGIDTKLAVGGFGASMPCRGLIKFDLTDLPSTATITSATLSLYCITDFSSNARTFRVYRQKRAWGEGNSNGGFSPTGVNWNNYDGVNNWQSAGGFGVNDCEQTDIGSRDFTAADGINAWKDFALTPTTKAALDLGNGWMLKTDVENADRYDFASSDHGTASLRPTLTIEYTIPATIQVTAALRLLETSASSQERHAGGVYLLSDAPAQISASNVRVGNVRMLSDQALTASGLWVYGVYLLVDANGQLVSPEGIPST